MLASLGEVLPEGNPRMGETRQSTTRRVETNNISTARPASKNEKGLPSVGRDNLTIEHQGLGALRRNKKEVVRGGGGGKIHENRPESEKT